MGHNIVQGAGGLSFVEIQRFCGICPKTLKLIEGQEYQAAMHAGYNNKTQW
jgi:hypothetical protein